MLKFDRTYCKQNHSTKAMEWYFNGRKTEGTFGPFGSKEEAQFALEEFIRFNIEFSDDGGRSLASNSQQKIITAC